MSPQNHPNRKISAPCIGPLLAWHWLCPVRDSIAEMCSTAVVPPGADAVDVDGLGQARSIELFQ